jgi:uncharacterized membrane protein
MRADWQPGFSRLDIAWALLKVPALLVPPQMEAVWLGIGEPTVLLAGGWILFAEPSGLRKGSAVRFLTGEDDIRSARMLFAVSLVPIGLSHLVYVKETAELVPSWLPYRGWAYLTGTGRIACGLGVLFSILPRVAAWAEAGMLSLFTLLVWVPAILAAPTTPLPWTAFFISWVIASAAWGSRSKHRSEVDCQAGGVTRSYGNFYGNRRLGVDLLYTLVAFESS